MNKFIESIKALDSDTVAAMIERDPKWITWAEPNGKNALHYLCGVSVGDDAAKSATSLAILKLLLEKGMDINSIQRIEEKNCDYFPATPLWYAYTRGRNEKIYKYLLKNGADSRNCWWAIAWYDDIAAGKLWLKHGAKIDENPTLDELFLGSFAWKKLNFAYWLIGQGADVSAADDQGNTALMTAVKRKDEQDIKRLVKLGADADMPNAKGVTARQIAIDKGPKRLLEMFA